MRSVMAAAFGGLLLIPSPGSSQGAESARVIVVYFVRHGEVDPTQPTFPLSTAGKLRANTFAQTVRDVTFTHIMSSHTTRAKQMVEPVAQAQRLAVQQFPAPGTHVDGVLVSDSSPSPIATMPLVKALRSLPRGSSALVGVNSDNVFAILHELGVPVASPDRPCAKGSTCVPCLSNECFPGGYDQLWLLIIDPGSEIPKLIELRYGTTSPN